MVSLGVEEADPRRCLDRGSSDNPSPEHGPG